MRETTQSEPLERLNSMSERMLFEARGLSYDAPSPRSAQPTTGGATAPRDLSEHPFGYNGPVGSSDENRIESRVDARVPATTWSAGVAASIGVVDR